MSSVTAAARLRRHSFSAMAIVPAVAAALIPIIAPGRSANGATSGFRSARPAFTARIVECASSACSAPKPT
jgi:hypothetical protein